MDRGRWKVLSFLFTAAQENCGCVINARVFVGMEVVRVVRRLVTSAAGFLGCDCATLIRFLSLYNIVTCNRVSYLRFAAQPVVLLSSSAHGYLASHKRKLTGRVRASKHFHGHEEVQSPSTQLHW